MLFFDCTIIFRITILIEACHKAAIKIDLVLYLNSSFILVTPTIRNLTYKFRKFALKNNP